MSHLRAVSCKRRAESINLLRGRTGSSLCLKDVGETCLWSLMLFKSITGVHQLRSFISSPISHILKAFLVPGPASNAGITKPRNDQVCTPPWWDIATCIICKNTFVLHAGDHT